jgi:hypothetical protein
MHNAVYLVVEPIEIIALDLAMNVQDYDSTATVLVASSLDVGCDVLEGHASVSVAFVHTDPQEFDRTRLGRALYSRGAQLVFTGDRAERNGAGVLVLHRPFSSQTTAELLKRTERSETA